MVTLCHTQAAEEWHQQKKRVRERERDKTLTRKRRKGKFDTATSSFLNLLIIQSYRKKLKKAKLKNSFQLRKRIKTNFCLENSIS